MIQFYKDGDHMGIVTDCSDVDTFLDQLSSALSGMIDKGAYEGDWEFQLRFWLPNAFEICCRLRGLSEANVTAKMCLSSGPGARADTFFVAMVDDNCKLMVTSPSLKAE